MIMNKTIREQVAAYLKDLILQQQFEPGERVPEQEIADTLEVSRGPIREALRQLEQEGLVEYRRNKGCFVRKFTRDDAFEVFYLRSVLEVGSVTFCNGEFPPGSLVAMEDALLRMNEEVSNKSVKGFVQEDQIFHEAIVNACGMKRISEIYRNLSSLNVVLFLTESRQKFILEDQSARHEELFQVMKRGDLTECVKAIQHHYATTTALNR